MRRRWILLVAGFGGIIAILAVARFGPALSLSLALAAPAAEKWVSRVRPEPVREETAIPAPSGLLRADVYRPQRARGALLLVHGLSRMGRRQPDLARLAGLLAQHGVLVVVPQFEGLAAFRLDGREVDDVRSALRYTATLDPSSGVAGFSFGAGPALLAADEVPGLRVVGSFGGYADLRHVIRYVTTGVHDLDGSRYVQRQEPYNRWKLLALLVGLVESDRDRRILEEVAQRRLANPADDTSDAEAKLDSGGRAILALVANRQDDAVDGLIEQLPVGTREMLRRLSPMSAVSRLSSRVLIAHGMADESIPFTESLRLAAAAGSRGRLALFESFHHTGPTPVWSSMWYRAGDGWRLVRVVDELLPR